MAQNTISDELNRLIQAKAGIKSALEEKGLTIGDSSTLDEFPALIEDMPSGGGSGGYDTSTVIDLIEGDISGNFEIPAGTIKIKTYAFYRQKELTGVTIPNGVVSIGDLAFMECDKLENVIIPNSVTSLPSQGFYQCPLSSVIIPNSVTSIGQRCFYKNKLQSVIIGTGTTSIQNYAFDLNDNTLQEIVILGTSPAQLGYTVFGSNNSPIFVKNSVVDTYKNAGGQWNNVSTRITPLASAAYDASTYTVQASGRDNLELYVDASLCDSSVYTFTPGAADASHNIMVKSVDPSLGVLDTYNLEILVEGAAPSYSATAPTFTVNQPTYTYDYDEGTAMVRVRVDISTGQLEGYQGQYNVSTNCTNYTGDMASMSSTYSNRQDFNYITYFDDPVNGPFTFGFTTEAYYKDENQNLLYTAGPATFSDTVTPDWNIPERIAPYTLMIQSNEQPDEYSITVSTDSDGDFVVSITDSNGQTIMDNEVITNSGGPTEIATLPRPEYGEGETYYDIAVYTKGTETYNRSEPELTTVTVYGKEVPEPLAPPTIEITSERADRFMSITNNDENADQIYYSIIRDGDYVETDTLFSSQVQVNIGDQITAYAHDSNGVYPDSEPDSVDVE